MPHVTVGEDQRQFGTVDFDPSAQVLNLTSFGPEDAFVWKLNASGALVWARQAGGGIGTNTASGVAVDSSGAVYVTGGFQGTADFDPGPEEHLLVEPLDELDAPVEAEVGDVGVARLERPLPLLTNSLFAIAVHCSKKIGSVL